MPQDESPDNRKDSASAGGTSPVEDLAAETGWQSGGAPQNPLAGLRAPLRDSHTHELLEMISELEDERRWARLREGLWLALLFHILVLSLITWIPKYFFHQAAVIDPIDALQKKNLQYLDLPPDALAMSQPKMTVQPAPAKPPRVDKSTLDRLQAEQPAAEPPPAAPTPTAVPETPAPTQPTITPQQQSPSPFESPKPSAVPARPSFAMNSQSPTDQLRDAMRGSRNSGAINAGTSSGGHMPLHPGAGAGGVEVLSDTQGVDFSAWLHRWHDETLHTWDPLIPDEVNAPIGKRGQVAIRFKVLPNGRLMEGSLVLVGRSGDTALDRAAWGALTGSNYPGLPRDFHGPYLELQATFLYNMESQ